MSTETIDPGAVKAGDTVTLRIEQDDNPALALSGKTHTPATGHGVYLGGWRIDSLPDYVAITDHQPAPEPEVDRLAQTIWEASRADEGTISATGADHVAATIRNKFAVIDLDDVDVDALVAVTYGSGADTRHLVVIALLAALGIEVDR